jgi:hypothetical protein
MKKNKIEKKIKEEQLVEVIPYARINDKDILILRCKKGDERKALLEMRSELKFIIQQKDLRILAVNEDIDFSQLSILIQATKEYEEKPIEN